MGLIKSYKANKAIDILLDADNIGSIEAKEAIEKIKQIGDASIVNLIDAIPEAGTVVIEQLLTGFLNNKTLPSYIDALADTDNRIVKCIMSILVNNNMYDSNRLLELVDDPDIPKNVLVHILLAHKERLKPVLLARLINNSEKGGRQVLFRVLETIADESSIEELSNLTYHKIAAIRQMAIKILSGIDSTDTRDILYRCIPDTHRIVRVAALDGLLRLSVPIQVEPIIEYLKDRDLATQSKAIELLIKIKDPETITFLIEILEDDSEFVRRAAVEVLNEISDHRSIKALIETLRDKDWWVRVRAADALGTIGGPKVVDAIFALMSDKDDFLRRTAVEILNNIKDDRAFTHLIKALHDEDWWVKERAADALAKSGDKRAVPALLEMLNNNKESRKIAIKTLIQILGNEEAITQIKNEKNLNSMSKKEILSIMSNLSDLTLEVDLNSNGNTRLLGSANVSSIIQKELKDTRINEALERPNTHGEPSTQQHAITEAIINPGKLQKGDIIADRYEVIKPVGKGAFGTVILVEDTIVNEKIILKFLNSQVASDENMIRRFVHELRYARKITHENVIRIYDFLRIGSSNAISMEYFESHSISYEIKNNMTSDHLRMIKILLDICNGMSYAHRANVVHRDLKPANILVDDNDLVKIVDFGLAAAASQTDSRITKSGILVGTPTYMAPEQVRDKEIDARTDIYSLGVLMYEIFTGQAPYKGKDSMAILFQHVEGKAKHPSEINPDISEALDAIIMKALKVDPSKRYQSVDELRSHLARFAVTMKESC